MSLIDGYYGNFNNVDSVWGRVGLVYAKKAAFMLSRAGVADVTEYARYGRAVGRHTSLALKRVGMSLASLVSIRNMTNQALHARELEELKAARSRQEEVKALITDKIADDEKTAKNAWVMKIGAISDEGVEVTTRENTITRTYGIPMALQGSQMCDGPCYDYMIIFK